MGDLYAGDDAAEVALRDGDLGYVHGLLQDPADLAGAPIERDLLLHEAHELQDVAHGALEHGRVAVRVHEEVVLLRVGPLHQRHLDRLLDGLDRGPDVVGDGRQDVVGGPRAHFCGLAEPV